MITIDKSKWIDRPPVCEYDLDIIKEELHSLYKEFIDTTGTENLGRFIDRSFIETEYCVFKINDEVYLHVDSGLIYIKDKCDCMVVWNYSNGVMYA